MPIKVKVKEKREKKKKWKGDEMKRRIFIEASAVFDFPDNFAFILRFKKVFGHYVTCSEWKLNNKKFYSNGKKIF